MRPAGRIRAVAVAGLAAAGLGTGLGGCGGPPPPEPPPPSTVATAPTQARAQLAALAAAGKDRWLVAAYTLRTPGRADRTVQVVRASDGSWRVDVPGGALGGQADVSVVRNRDGLYQCALPSGATIVATGCVRVAGPTGRMPAAVDPRVQHPFGDWLDVLTDRQVALSVAPATVPAGLTGTCYSVESTSVSIAAPLDVGIYCFAGDGTLTGARLGFGTLVLAGAPAEGPRSAALPGPVVAGTALPTAAPPPPPTPSAPASPSPPA